jgi:4-hydroxy-tetrahydrodipicolinate reductase
VSGTAKVLANNLEVENSDVKSVRAGGIVGKHEIIFGFPFQTVRLTHESISREAFGNGVIFVIKNIIDKDKGFYHYEDLMKPFFEF